MKYVRLLKNSFVGKQINLLALLPPYKENDFEMKNS